MSEIYKVFDDSGLTALTDHMKTTRTKANSNEAAIETLGEDLVELSSEVVTALGNKQDKLTFDSTPTSGSANPVTSTGVKTYVDNNFAAKTHEHLFDRGVTTEGDGAAYTATVDGITALEVGLSFIMIPHTASTSKTCTLNINSLGAKMLRRPISSNNVSTVAATTDNWITANKPIRVMYNGTYWIVMDMPRPNAPDLYGTVPVANGGVPSCSADNNGQFLRVVDGVPTWATIANAEGSSY